ncbi:MAG: Crp/Fnr family transcriptional regulator [Spirosomataceae bacterium]|jgi:CRP-like cAMP-binding protein|nr:Crp/Fnr family transcriptional regulator [Bacteroidota bacterium]
MTHSQKLFKDFLKSLIPLTAPEFKKIISIFEEISFKKGEMPIEMGKSSDSVLFITKGVFREFTLINDEEHTLWISVEGEAVLDVSNFMSGEPSRISVEALTNAQVLKTNKEKFEQMLLENPKMSIVMNKVYFQNLHEIREHQILLKIWPTQKREELLFQTKPYLFRKEIKIKHLASLLNVHPNSLSRIHNQKSDSEPKD